MTQCLKLAGAVFLCGIHFLWGGDPDTGPKSPFLDLIEAQKSAGTGSVRLYKTGETQRNFLFFPIYRMSHYAQSLSGNRSILDWQGTKAVRLEFLRELKGDRIRDDFLNTLRARAPGESWESIRASAHAYCAPFSRGNVRSGDRFSVIWFPDGTLVSRFNGIILAKIDDPRFARVLWSIWVGENSIVDRDALLKHWESPAESTP